MFREGVNPTVAKGDVQLGTFEATMATPMAAWRTCSRPRAPPGRCCASVSTSRGRMEAGERPRVKVCGITTPEDARLAADSGADYVGMICWSGSKRDVKGKAKEVAQAAKEGGSIPVCVFVDGTAEDIVAKCEEADVEYAQLHGEEARRALPEIPTKIKVIYAISVDAEGNVLTPMPSQAVDEYNRAKASVRKQRNPVTTAYDWVSGGRRTVEWLLIDGVRAGSGETFGWNKLKVPKGCSRKGWLLAGGLGPDNVQLALETLRPDGVDVATGVSDEGGVRKDETKVKAFVQAVERTAAALSP